MNIQVTQENLSQALGNLARVASSSRGSLPILNNILLRTVKGRLSMSATNLEIAITQSVGAKVNQEGVVTVPARLFQEYINSLPSGTVDIEVTDHKIYVKSADYRSTINGMLADDYPVIPEVKDEPIWKVNTKIFKEALNQVVFAASTDDARPVLTGVLLHSVDGEIYLAATDSYRLSEKLVGKSKAEFSLLIPASALADLQRIIGDKDEDIFVHADTQQVAFRFAGIELVSRLIEGTYPEYRKLLPASFANSADLEKAEFVSASKLASLFARESAGSIMIELSPDTKSLSVKSAASQIGENNTSIPANISGDGASISLNSRFLIDGLASIQGPSIIFNMNGKLDPCVLKSPDHTDYLHIIMPLKS
ncbi:DNA polymerase III subunit beta [Candidatus Saccharibacteria bacterium]|nr:DNA polymerase III subunit beta [Candidatus Saccharibacteria bacterium]MCB9821115.1 DNA polymerase III subunit beta [Candidatus Nomurabacteria bacterium]